MLAGISTACFYPLYTEEAVQKLSRIPPQCVEVFLNARHELDPAYLRELRRRADAAGILIKSVHPYTSGMEPMYFFSNYDRRFVEGIEIYRDFYQAANILGAGIVVFHGGIRHFNLDYDDYFARFERLWLDAKKHGVDLCQENVQRCTSYTPEFFKAMAAALPDVGYVLDTKQAVRAGEDVYSFADSMSTRIRHVHISDHSPAHDCLAPGKGVLNIAKLLSIITKNGFDGSVIVELYRENFNDFVELERGYQQVFTAISTILKND